MMRNPACVLLKNHPRWTFGQSSKMFKFQAPVPVALQSFCTISTLIGLREINVPSTLLLIQSSLTWKSVWRYKSLTSTATICRRVFKFTTRKFWHERRTFLVMSQRDKQLVATFQCHLGLKVKQWLFMLPDTGRLVSRTTNRITLRTKWSGIFRVSRLPFKSGKSSFRMLERKRGQS